jgi:AcrR family transcriptional regulator
VGRSTFYTHFQDKDDLLTSEMSNLRDMLRAAQVKTPVASARHYEKIIGFSLMMFEHAYEYRHVYKALVASQGGAVVLQHIPDMLADLIRDESKIEFEKGRKKDSEIPIELFVHFIASAFVSVMSWWLDHKNPLPPKTINAIFRALVIPSLASHFD